MSRGVFVPGKVILTGEHAVVYGKMALAASISLGVRVTVSGEAGGEQTDLVKKAIEVAGGGNRVQVKIESELPIGSGLGSSAAAAAAVIKAVRNHLGEPIENDELFELTLECERLAHGNPSGIDPATVVYGGLIAYRKGKPLEKLKIKKPIKLLLIDTGRPEETTREMVEWVAQRAGKERIIESIGRVSREIKERLVRGDEFLELIDQNGLLLEELGVVSDQTRKLSRELRNMGASVKVTGAGGRKEGSGMMMVMGSNLAKVRLWLEDRGVNYIRTEVGKK